MTDNFENKVAVDGPVVNEGELGSSTFSPGQVSPAGPLGSARLRAHNPSCFGKACYPPYFRSQVLDAQQYSAQHRCCATCATSEPNAPETAEFRRFRARHRSKFRNSEIRENPKTLKTTNPPALGSRGALFETPGTLENPASSRENCAIYYAAARWRVKSTPAYTPPPKGPKNGGPRPQKGGTMHTNQGTKYAPKYSCMAEKRCGSGDFGPTIVQTS